MPAEPTSSRGRANSAGTRAGALPLAGLTAWRALVTRARVEPGDRVLIAGAGAGTATFLVQIARRWGPR